MTVCANPAFYVLDLLLLNLPMLYYSKCLEKITLASHRIFFYFRRVRLRHLLRLVFALHSLYVIGLKKC